MSSFQPESLLGIELPPVLSDKDLTAMAVRIAENAKAHPVVYEDRTSEAALDQGWGLTQLGTPIEDEDHPRRKEEAIIVAKAAQERRRKRHARHETQYTDVASDLAEDPPRVAASHEATADVPTDVIMGAGHLAARRVVEAISAINVINQADNDPKLGMALARAHYEHHRK